ncbi:acetoin reductase family protein [Salix suchowensis]|nr:acetoin reductase family protein [Salix suchowensis]
MSNPSSPSQSNRVAIITGAAQGLGRAIALRLASDGFDVALNDIPAKSTALEELVTEIKAGSGTNSDRRAIFVPGSVADEEDVKELVDRTVRELGGLDVVRLEYMVSNAGVALMDSLLIVYWDALYAVNVRGTFLCYKHAANAMIKQGRGGRIVGELSYMYVACACSIAGKKGFPDSSAYSSSKFAVRGLTQSAGELTKHVLTLNKDTQRLNIFESPRIRKIRDNGECVRAWLHCHRTPCAPSSFLLITGADCSFGTVLIVGKFDAYNVKKQGLEPGQWTETLKNRAALGKLLTPTDIANLVSFMVSKDASFITGELSTSSTVRDTEALITRLVRVSAQ